MDLNDYLRVFRQHWLGGVLIIVACVAASLGFSALQPRVYAADATGFVGTGGATDSSTGMLNDSLARSRAKSYADLAKGRATAQTVIDDLDLDTSPAALATRIDVEQTPDTVLLRITARAGTPKAAQQLADAWVRALAEQVQEVEAPGEKTTPAGVPRIVPVEQAALPRRPVSPNVPRNGILGFTLGCMLAAAYATVRATIDRRIRTPSDVDQKFPVAVVGAVPVSPSLQPHGKPQAYDLETGAAEALRKLRTNLIYIDVDQPPRTLVVTSPQPGDGKSTIAANLASTMVLTGESVILIDADLRKPTQADRFGLDDAVGLTSVLTGQIDVSQALQSSPASPTLQVLTSGPLPPNPSELLSSQAWRTLLERLSERAVVVIDAPPVLPVTDAALLARAADGAFIVVSHSKTRDDDLRHSLQALDAVSARALGVVINRVPRRSRSYYGYGGYGYGAESAQDRPRATGVLRRWRPAPATRRTAGGARRRRGDA